MVLIAVKCPSCEETDVVKYGKGKRGQQRYKCQNKECSKVIFQLEYHNNGCKPGIENEIIKKAVNASGIRDTARSLKVSKYKVSSTLKKQEQ